MGTKYEPLRVDSEHSSVDVIVPVDPELKLRPQLLGPHAANPLVQHNSSARSYMYMAHQSQSVTLLNGDAPILQTGVDQQFGKYTFGPRIESDVVVLRSIKRYGNNIGGYSDAVVEKLYLVLKEEYNETTGTFEKTLDVLDVNDYHTGFHQDFGFSYVHNTELLDSLRRGTVLKEGELLSHSPSVSNDEYKVGLNCNMLLCTHPDVTEDSVVISESFAKKAAYDVFQTPVVSYGTTKIPLNLYGNDTEYKPFPEIGEYINEDSVIMAFRDFNDFGFSSSTVVEDVLDFTPALLSNKALREFNPIFDKCIYVKGPGTEVDLGEYGKRPSGIVIDIKCYKNDKKESALYSNMADETEKYVRSYTKFCEDVIEAYHSICMDLEDADYGYGHNIIHKTPRLHNLIVSCGKIGYKCLINKIKNNPQLAKTFSNIKKMRATSGSKSAVLPNKIGLSNKNEILDTYRIEFVVRYTNILTKGNKISDQNGGKGVISDVRPDHLMPYNKYGRADAIMNSGSIISRMNLGRNYIQYFSGVSRHCRETLRSMANGQPIESLDSKIIEKMYTHLMGLLGKFNTKQFDAYAHATEEEKIEILKECVEDEVQLLYQVDNEKTAYQIVMDIEKEGNKYAPPRDNVVIPVINQLTGEYKEATTKQPMLIAPLYTIVICKTADNMLFCNSPYLNNFAFPISVAASNRDDLPYRNNPVKTVSETEGRLYRAYANPEFIAELKDRASPDTHKIEYENILKSKKPTNVDCLISRDKIPYGNDSSLKLFRSILRSIGIDYTYVPGGY